MPSAVGYQPTLAEEMGVLQERITSTKTGSITIQGRVRAGGRFDRPVTGDHVCALDATVVLSRDIAALGIYPAVDPLIRPRASSTRKSWVTSTTPVAPRAGHVAALRNWRDIIAILGMDELSPDDKLAVARGKSNASCRSRSTSPKSSPGAGKIVPPAETIRGFKMIVEGECDALPEQLGVLHGSAASTRRLRRRRR